MNLNFTARSRRQTSRKWGRWALLLNSVALFGIVSWHLFYFDSHYATVNSHAKPIDMKVGELQAIPILNHDDANRQPMIRKSGTLIHKLASPQEQLEDLLKGYPDTPASHFVQLLRDNLYTGPRHELERLEACNPSSLMKRQGSYKMSKSPLCLAGKINFEAARKSVGGDMSTLVNPFKMENHTNMSYVVSKQEGHHNEQHTTTVYDLRRYRHIQPNGQNDKQMLIPNMHYEWIELACYPLLLAGAAVALSSENQIVEVGPLFGMSSKCISTGLEQERRKTQEASLVALDTFVGPDWDKVIESNATLYNMTENGESSHVLLQNIWKDVVSPVSQSAQSIDITLDPPKTTNTVTNPEASSLAMMVVHGRSSAVKSILQKSIVDEDAGQKDEVSPLFSYASSLLSLNGSVIPTGTIIVWMQDLMGYKFKQVFGCWRQLSFLQPVYVSWQVPRPHWIFVVTKPIPLDKNDVKNTESLRDVHLCYAHMARDVYRRGENKGEDSENVVQQRWFDLVNETMKKDIEFLAQGLSIENGSQIVSQEMQDELFTHMMGRLEEKPYQWTILLGE